VNILSLPDEALRNINPLQLEPIRNYDFALQIEGQNIGEVLIGGFSEIVGLSGNMENIDIYSGGQRQVMPWSRYSRNSEVTLRKGFTANRFLENWYHLKTDYDWGNPDYHRKVTIISLGQVALGIQYEVRAWVLLGASPVRWSLADLNSSGDNLLLEELVLQYQFLFPSKGIFDNALGRTLGLFQ
jgi:phage tail-like protein